MHRLSEITINDLAALLLIMFWIVGVVILTLVAKSMPDTANGVALIAVGWLFRGQTNGAHLAVNKPISEVVP